MPSRPLRLRPRRPTRRRLGLLPFALVTALTLAACSDDDPDVSSASDTSPSAPNSVDDLGPAASDGPVVTDVRVDTVPTETVPTETVPTETVPTETVPTETVVPADCEP